MPSIIRIIATLLIIIPTLFVVSNCAHTGRSDAAISNSTESMRVMSFNIRFDNPDDGPNAWPHRSDLVASVIRFHHADLVGIQEGLISQLEDMDRLLPAFDRVGVGRDDGGDKGEFSAIFYRADRFDPVESGTFWLSDTPDVPGSVGWDAALPRVVTWAKLFDKKNDQSFFAFNTHFDHRGRDARLQSAKLILEKIHEIAGDEPVVLTGDLNVTEDQGPYEVLTNPDHGPEGVELFDGFYHSRYDHHGPTTTWTGFREIIPDRRIDYVFVNAGFSVIQHGILADIRDGYFPSDHLPVLGEIEFAR